MPARPKDWRALFLTSFCVNVILMVAVLYHITEPVLVCPPLISPYEPYADTKSVQQCEEQVRGLTKQLQYLHEKIQDRIDNVQKQGKQHNQQDQSKQLPDYQYYPEQEKAGTQQTPLYFYDPKNSSSIARIVKRKVMNAIQVLDNMEFKANDCGYLLEHCYLHQYSALPPPDPKKPLVFVMAFDGGFERVAPHTIGSIHTWEPNSKIVIYDLGRWRSEAKAEMKHWCNVEVREFEFDKYPPHVKHLNNYSWKPIIIKQAVEEFGVIFWVDASIELRADITEIKEHIYYDGYFAASSHPFISTWTYEAMFRWFGESKTDSKWTQKGAPMMISAAAVGARYPSSFYDQVIVPVEKCALDKECIAPQFASKGNHRFDQSAFSIMMALGHFPVFADHRFNAWQANDKYLQSDAFAVGSIINLLTRRGGGGPYAGAIKKSCGAENKQKHK